MKKTLILMLVGTFLIIGGLLAAEYWVLNPWFLLVPVGGFAIFIQGTIKLIKNIENENY